MKGKLPYFDTIFIWFKFIIYPIYELELIIYTLAHNILDGDEIMIDSKDTQAR